MENINIASFDFDPSKLDKSLIDLKNKMTILKNEMTATRKSANDIAKEFTATSKKMLELEQAGEDTSDEYKELAENSKLLSGALNLQNGLLQTQESQMRLLKNEYKSTSDIANALTNSENELVSARERGSQAIEREITSIASARANNKELLAIRNQLNPNIAEEASLIQELNEKLDSNNNLIKENASAYEQQKINIGNYSESIKDAAQNMNPLNGGIIAFISRSQEAGGVGNLLTGSLKQMTAGIAGVTKASLAFIATPIGIVLAAIAAAVGLVANAMNRSEESTNKVQRAIAPLVGWFNKLLEILEPVGEFIIDGFVAYLDLMEKQLYATFDALSWILDKIGADGWAEGVKNFRNELEATSTASKELADAEAQLEENQRKARLTQLEYQKEAEKLRQIRDDETLSTKERIAANEQLGVVLKNQLQEELRLAQTALKVANLRIEQEGRTKEALDAQYAALTEIADIEERITGQQSEQLTNRVALEKEAADKAKEIRNKAEQERQKAFDREIQRMNEELDLWVAQQGEKARTLQEEIELQRRIADDSIKILQKELEAKKISQTKYQTEVLKIQNELGQQQAELVAQNAEDELNEWLRKNESILAEENRLTEELVTAENDRLTQLQAQRESFELTRFQQGLINEREYQNELLAIAEETEQKKIDIQKQYEAQRRAEEILLRQTNFESDIQQMIADGATRWEIEQAQRDEQYQADLERLEEQRTQGLISLEQYEAQKKAITLKYDNETADAKKQIEELVAQTKMQLASQAFGVMAEVLGKETAAGKAAAVAQATIDTYAAAVSAYNAMAGIPIVGPALGAVAAGIAVATGLLNVKKIVSTKTPKVSGGIGGYATGGRIVQGYSVSRPNGDDVLITAKRGEVILNESQQQRAGGAPFFQALGVPGFATGGMVGTPPSQNSYIQQQITNQINTEAITEAVRQGAMEGSAQGSEVGTRTGSQSGIRDLNTDLEIARKSAF